MSQKRRGLGRGLGALIPAAPGGDRPVDVFFPGTERKRDEASGSVLATVAESADSAVAGDDHGEGADGSRPSSRARTWDSAVADGRLKIRTGQDELGAIAPTDATIDPIAALSGLAERLENEASTTPKEVVDGGARIGTVAADPLGPASIPAEPSEVSRETAELLPVPGAHFAEIPVDAIRPNAWQPRSVFDEAELDELVDSIKEIGILQPIVVRPSRDGEDTYELIMGERRWRAAQTAGLDTIPSIVRETDDGDMLRDALLENLHRAALNPLEEAAAYRQLLDDFGCTHEELAARIARSRPQISNTLRLLKLPPLVQRRVAAGVLSAGHARALLGLTDGAEIERLAQRIVSEGLSVRATEEIVTLMTTGDDAAKVRRAPRAGQRSVAVDDLASRLSDRFETRVKVSLGKSKGRLTVEFASVDDLNRILELMAPEDPGLLRP